uniref:hypothetical protein n=1 Tax=Leptospira santarosai TaxID=28183 RepID=UPI001C4003ED
SYHFTFSSSGPVFRSLLTTFGVDSAQDILSKELVKCGLDSTLTKRKRRYGDKIPSKRQAPSSIF